MDRRKSDLRLLFALIKGANRSDREIARVLKTSQPTVSRSRRNLEKQGYIGEYTIIPDLSKMGYDFIAVTLISFAEDSPELFGKAREWASRRSSVIYATNGEGFGMNSIMVSVHPNYASYSKLITELRRDWQPNLKNTETFIVSLARPDTLIKPFSFQSLEGNM
jgi:DNA-binding Lrp family transcriptional regulator